MKFTRGQEFIAEFFGTMVLILFGDGVVAMVVLFGKGTPGEIVHGGFTNITLAWGLAVTMGCYIAGRISGAHLNPAVSLAFALRGTSRGSVSRAISSSSSPARRWPACFCAWCSGTPGIWGRRCRVRDTPAGRPC